MSGARVGLLIIWVYLYCCCSASSMQWMRHYLRWYSCCRRSHCCSPLNSGQSGGKHGHAYLADWPKLRPPLHSAVGRKRRRTGGCLSSLTMRHCGTGGLSSSVESWDTTIAGWVWVSAAVHRRFVHIGGKKKKGFPNLLDGVMMNDVGSLADLVVVLKGGHSSLSLLQLLSHQLLCLHWRGAGWRGWWGTVGEWWGCLLNNTLLYFLLLLQCFDKRGFQPIRMLGFQSLLLIGWHAIFAEHRAAFRLVLPPAAGEVSIALGTDERVSDDWLGQRDTRLSWMGRDGKWLRTEAKTKKPHRKLLK